MTSANPILEKTIPGLGEKVEHARERAGDMAHRMKERAIAKEGEFEDYVRDHPLRSILMAAGIGAGLGLAIGALLARR